jgi:hypothetical protein
MTDERTGAYPEDEPTPPPSYQPTPPPSQQPTPPPSSQPTPPPGMPEEHDDAAVLVGAGDFTSGEGLVAFAGIVLLAVWLIFDIVLASYGMDNTVAVLAAAALLLPRLDRAKVEQFHPLPSLMKVLGYALVAFGIVEVILDVRFGALDEFSAVLGALISYAGYAMAFWGARQIEI